MNVTRTRILETARELFLARNYGAVGTKEICQSAGINKGTLYHFFPSKSALLAAAITEYAEEFALAFDEIAESKIAPDKKIAAIFEVPESANRKWQQLYGKTQGCLVGNMTLELGSEEPEVQAASLAALKLWKAKIRPILAEYRSAQGASVPDSAIAVDAATDRLIAMLQGGLLLCKAYNDPGQISAMIPVALASIGPQTDGKA